MFDQIEQHYGLYLAAIAEPKDNVLRLVIEEARSTRTLGATGSGIPEVVDLAPIVSDDTCFAYEVLFQWYVAYSVRNEAYVHKDTEETYTGRLVRVYSRSRFLDFVRASTFATDEYPGPITHYEFNCLNHIVDVAALDTPETKVIRNPVGTSKDKLVGA